jgi:hypothetical protein
MRGISDALLDLARKHNGELVTLDEAARVLFKVNGDTGQAAAVRKKLYLAVYYLKTKGDLHGPRGAFGLSEHAPPAPPADSLPPDVEEAAPLPASTRVAHRLNRLALALDAAHEQLSELRHDLRVREAFADLRPSFPMRCSWPGERDE